MSINLQTVRQHREGILKAALQNGIMQVAVSATSPKFGMQSEPYVTLIVTPSPSTGLEFFGFVSDVRDLLGEEVQVVCDPTTDEYGRIWHVEGAQPL